MYEVCDFYTHDLSIMYSALDILEHLVKKRIQVKIELLDSFVD